jgi:hypothetical protein
MNRYYLAVSFLTFILLFVGACGQMEISNSAASDIGVSETAAPELPTATAEIPTATAEMPTATIQPLNDPQILFIGDSFTSMFDGLDNHIVGLAASRNPPLEVTAEKIAPGGMSIWGHFIGTTPAVPTIQEGNWTVVVLQDDLEYYDYDVQKFNEFNQKFNEEIERIGAKTILYQSWKQEYIDPQRIEEITDAYANLSKELGADVAPVGQAWSKAIAERPTLDLYSEDRTHANIAGMYLTLAVIYATIFDESPEGLPYLPENYLDGNVSDDWKISEGDIEFLQRIAWETVVEYRENNS